MKFLIFFLFLSASSLSFAGNQGSADVADFGSVFREATVDIHKYLEAEGVESLNDDRKAEVVEMIKPRIKAVYFLCSTTAAVNRTSSSVCSNRFNAATSEYFQRAESIKTQLNVSNLAVISIQGSISAAGKDLQDFVDRQNRPSSSHGIEW